MKWKITYPYSSHCLIQSLSFFSSHLAPPLYKSRLQVAPYFFSLFSWYHFFIKLSDGLSFFFSLLLYSTLFSDHVSVVLFYHQPLFNFALSILTNCHGGSLATTHRSKCPVCIRLMRGGDNHPNKCRSCHGCTVDNKCNTCSQWTDVVWASIVEHSQAQLHRKRHAVSEAHRQHW